LPLVTSAGPSRQGSVEMLVLSRSRDQEIVIDSIVRMRIGVVVCGRVKLLIDAPRECLVRRSEVEIEANATALTATT
jgi:sRNA-binding carbon storage regulator CsrA